MCDKTPNKNNQVQNGFSPITLPISPSAAAPGQNLTGNPRVTKDLVADLYNNVQHWNDYHIKGARIVKLIIGLKFDKCHPYPPKLDELCFELHFVVKHLNDISKLFTSYLRKIEALVSLNPDNLNPLFISLSLPKICKLFYDINEAYSKEFNLKKRILTNIPHSKNFNEALNFANIWTYQQFITDSINLKLETLLVETGHKKFN